MYKNLQSKMTYFYPAAAPSMCKVALAELCDGQFGKCTESCCEFEQSNYTNKLRCVE